MQRSRDPRVTGESVSGAGGGGRISNKPLSSSTRNIGKAVVNTFTNKYTVMVRVYAIICVIPKTQEMKLTANEKCNGNAIFQKRHHA